MPTNKFLHNINHFLPFFESNHLFLPRTDALENDPTYKQLIPYIVLHHYQRDTGIHSVFSYRRRKGGEARLNNKRSIGIGGHINYMDRHPELSVLERGMIRELNEELVLNETPVNEKPFGLLYDPSNDVGKVHVGVVFIVDIKNPVIFPKEDCIADTTWMTIDSLRRSMQPLESWSSILIEHLPF